MSNPVAKLVINELRSITNSVKYYRLLPPRRGVLYNINVLQKERTELFEAADSMGVINKWKHGVVWSYQDDELRSQGKRLVNGLFIKAPKTLFDIEMEE